MDRLRPPYTDLKSAEDAIPKLGGQVLTPWTKSAMGTSFVFVDSGGAVLAAYEPSGSFTVPSSSRESAIVWQRLYSANPEQSIGFYRKLFGWDAVNGEHGTGLFQDRSQGVAGDMGAKPSWIDSDSWVFFIGVSNVSQTATNLKDGGGSIVERATIQGQEAIVAKDSQGGVIGFVEH